jgi:hypothetical protein
MLMHQIEYDRLKFVEQRDGKEAAVSFARRTMQIYRSHVLNVKGWLNNDKRLSFIKSYLHFKHYYLREKIAKMGK